MSKKKLIVKTDIAGQLKDYCKDNKVTMGDMLEAIVFDIITVQKNLLKKENLIKNFAELAVDSQVAENYRNFCKNNNLDSQLTLELAIQIAIENNLIIEKSLKSKS